MKVAQNELYEESPVLELTPGADEFYDFWFSITFRNKGHPFVAADMRFGIKKDGAGFVLRTGKDSVFDVANKEHLAALNEALYESFRDAFTWPESGPKQPYGFHPRRP
jgi:hypothetical protein